ncbi:TonB-dependent receptor [Tenacibaculum agarivorans]|uniref:TonB-dependent receptor n=1 Tax=Tenacibaculum agarivorans TaxID=1908389 RepID=UPI00094B86C6|nr:TonB-dependent receptor [Tenacibaculum agarivorans]
MNKGIILTVLMFVAHFGIAQKKDKTEKAKDTIIKTEVVEVVTSYAPKVTDAFKIKKKPVIKLSKNSERKALEYKVQTVPVASKFIPKSGVLKGIDVGDRERLFDNYFSLGFGNNLTPFVEGYFQNTNAFEYEYGGKINFISSSDPVASTPLSSSYYNASIDLFLKQEMRFFDWKVGANAYRNKYNWYGLPTDINFTDLAINRIEEEQLYQYYNIFGSIFFPNRTTEEVNGSIAYFTDSQDSDEIHADVDAKFAISLGRFGTNLEDLQLRTSINFVMGGFDRTYADPDQKINYSFATAGINPSYALSFGDFDMKIGGKAYYSFDLENSEGKFFAYPDVEANYPIIKRYANIYAGVKGDLTVNSYEGFTSENPHVSPTLNITQSSEAFNVFGGFRGILSGDFNYNTRVSFKKEESRTFFVLNESLSNGTTTATPAGLGFPGFGYGNSFDVVYDDITTIGFFGELTYDVSRRLNLGLNVEFNTFDVSNLEEAFNLPQVKADVFASYKRKKWYAGANLYFVGDRKGAQRSADTFTVIDLSNYIDLNVNGGYHFNDLFSVFLRANNITNSQYQRFTNFDAQGFQVIGGFIYKFDALF